MNAKSLSVAGTTTQFVLRHHVPATAPPVGVGRSIGCVTLLTLAGAKAVTVSVDAVKSDCMRFARTALLARPTDIFRVPGAFESADLPFYFRVEGEDTDTPPARPST